MSSKPESLFVELAAQADASRVITPEGVSNIFAYRYDFGNWNGWLNCNFSWGVINRNSCVFVSATEAGQEGVAFLGNAVYTVHNVSPYDGGVHFRVHIDWAGPLRFVVMILVVNP
jgi:hypothetical protein